METSIDIDDYDEYEDSAEEYEVERIDKLDIKRNRQGLIVSATGVNQFGEKLTFNFQRGARNMLKDIEVY